MLVSPSWGKTFKEFSNRIIRYCTRPLSWHTALFSYPAPQTQETTELLESCQAWKGENESTDQSSSGGVDSTGPVSAHFDASREVENVNFMPYRLWLKEPNGYLSGTWQVNQCLFIGSFFVRRHMIVLGRRHGRRRNRRDAAPRLDIRPSIRGMRWCTASTSVPRLNAGRILMCLRKAAALRLFLVSQAWWHHWTFHFTGHCLIQ